MPDNRETAAIGHYLPDHTYALSRRERESPDGYLRSRITGGTVMTPMEALGEIDALGQVEVRFEAPDRVTVRRSRSRRRCWRDRVAGRRAG